MRTFLVTLLSSTIAFTAPGAAQENILYADRLSLTLDTYKRVFGLYEPVFVTYSVENNTQTRVNAIVQMSYSFHKIEFSITFPDGHTKEFITGSIADGILMEKTYAPGIVGVSEVEMITNGATGELAFPVTGKYKIQARMWVGNHLEGQPQSVYIRAEPLEIEVQEPVGVDAEAIQFFSSKEEIVQLLGEGSVAYCKRSRDAECFGRVSKFLDQHPNSAYTPAILWDVADSVATGMLNVSSRSQTAIGLYNTFLGRWPDHPVAPRVMYRLATALDAAGRKQEAVALVGRFETTFPGRKDLLDLMRMNILHVRPESVK